MSNEPPAESKFGPVEPPNVGQSQRQFQLSAYDARQSGHNSAGLILSDDLPTITPNSAPQPQARAFRRLGRTAFFTAVLAIGIQVVAIVLANNQHLLLATGLAWVSIVVSAAAVLGGVVAAIQGKRRRLAVVAIVLGVLGNPLVLVWLFAALGS